LKHNHHSQLSRIIQEKFPDVTLSTPGIYKASKNAKRQGFHMTETTEFEKCLVVKMMDRTGLTIGRVAVMYGVNDRTVSAWRSQWCPRWGFDLQNTQTFQSKPMLGPSAKKPKL
jgi:hypothetical protein